MEKDLIMEDYKKFIQDLECKVIDNIKVSDIKMFNPTTLAYIGDAVYELFVRTFLVSKGSYQAGRLHKKAVLFVKAKSQAKIIDKIFEYLTEEEKDVVRRGRNAKTTSMPKNAELADYKYATGFEALLGYLYLNNHIDRLLQIMNHIPDILGQDGSLVPKIRKP